MIQPGEMNGTWQLDQLFGLEASQQELHGLMTGGRMHPVILFEGRKGLGKRHLAVWMAARLLCKSGLGAGSIIQPCGSCDSCKEVIAERHADVYIINENDGQIKTSAAELFQDHFNVLSATGQRIGIIMNADKLTTEAANRLLKTLEEPPAQARIILTSSRPLSLPATVLGRCLRWRLRPPPPGKVLEWSMKLLSKTRHRALSQDDLLRFAMSMGFSPGRIRSRVEEEGLGLDFAKDISDLLSSRSPVDVLNKAAHLARVKKAKVADVLDCVELELSSIFRKNFEGRLVPSINNENAWVVNKRVRGVLSAARRQAVMGKTVLNTQLVTESIGLCRWKEGFE